MGIPVYLLHIHTLYIFVIRELCKDVTLSCVLLCTVDRGCPMLGAAC